MDTFSAGLLVLVALCYLLSWYLVSRWRRQPTDWLRPLLILLLGPVLAFGALVVFVFLFWPPSPWISP